MGRARNGPSRWAWLGQATGRVAARGQPHCKWRGSNSGRVSPRLPPPPLPWPHPPADQSGREYCAAADSYPQYQCAITGAPVWPPQAGAAAAASSSALEPLPSPDKPAGDAYYVYGCVLKNATIFYVRAADWR